MADDDHQPAWLKASSSGTASAPSGTTAPIVGGSGGGSANPPYKSFVTGIWMVVNMGLMIFMAATGALGIGSSNSVNSTGVVFVGIYLILFAGIEFFFEVSQLCPGKALDNIMKRNFGFLYGNLGKGLFFLFVGILCFGLSTPRTLAIACGVLVAAWGVASIFASMKFPDYFEPKEKFQP